MAIWFFYGHLVYFPHFGMLHPETSGNPVCNVIVLIEEKKAKLLWPHAFLKSSVQSFSKRILFVSSSKLGPML
jgi:hypothetical protein